MKRFESEIKLQKHNKNKHESCPRFPCSKCDLRFCTPGMLEKHLNSHTDEKIIDNNLTEPGSPLTISESDQTFPTAPPTMNETNTIVMSIPEDMDLYIENIPNIDVTEVHLKEKSTAIIMDTSEEMDIGRENIPDIETLDDFVEFMNMS